MSTANWNWSDTSKEAADLPASYIVYLDGSTYKAKNGATGAIDSSDALASTVIQYALDNVSGTTQETIVLKGDFTIATTLTMSSYTTLEILGTVTSNITAGSAITATSKTNISIQGGGLLDVADKGGGNTGGIYLTTCTNCAIKDITIKDAVAHCININTLSSNIEVSGCTLDGFGDDGVSVLASRKIRILDNEILNGTSAVGGSAGVEIEDGSYEVIIQSNVIHDITGSGVHTICDAAGAAPNHEVSMFANVVLDCTTKGLWLQNSKTSLTGCTLSGDGTTATVTSAGHGLHVGCPIKVSSATDAAYDVYGVISAVTTDTFDYAALGSSAQTDGVVDFFETNMTLSGNVISRCLDGIYADNAHDVSICSNTITDTLAASSSGIQTVLTDGIVISANALSRMGGKGISILGVIGGVVSDNTIRDCGLGGSDNGMYLAANSNINSDYLIISGNVVSDTRATPLTKKISFWTIGDNITFVNNSENNLVTAGRTLGAATVNITLVNTGHTYEIIATGDSDFTLIGAADSNPGTTFTATAPGTGTGTAKLKNEHKWIMTGNNPWGTSSRGTATVGTGAAFIDVTHDLSDNDTDIVPDAGCFQVTPLQQISADANLTTGDYWISNIDHNSFRINVAATPAADIDFAWTANLDGITM